jgi:hypothetical protein
MIETAEQAAHRVARDAERQELLTLRREHTIVTQELAAAREQRDRYERFLHAIVSPCSRVALLDKMDLGEWAAEQAQTLLDGGEAECPNCCTPLHEGACVGEGDDEEADDYDKEPGLMSFLPECQACGDRRGTCSHSS